MQEFLLSRKLHDITHSWQISHLTSIKARTLIQVFPTVRMYNCLSAAWITQLIKKYLYLNSAKTGKNHITQICWKLGFLVWRLTLDQFVGMGQDWTVCICLVSAAISISSSLQPTRILLFLHACQFNCLASFKSLLKTFSTCCLFTFNSQ